MSNDRHALTPLIGAGESTCAQCQLLTESEEGDTWCAGFRKENGGWVQPDEDPDDDAGFLRLPQCLSAEREATRLREVEARLATIIEAANNLDVAVEIGEDVEHYQACLRAAMKE